ncbi:DUF4244 domain-containing protein [Nonomuraea sp. B12E4]|uniref:DUF4244 domain-containing protein n=1 Tax=Nonomuraea sp. B12E4 TaxID=3153564 RepID=UPI00325D4BC3
MLSPATKPDDIKAAPNLTDTEPPTDTTHKIASDSTPTLITSRARTLLEAIATNRSEASQKATSPTSIGSRLIARARRNTGRWLHCAAVNRERGMSTAEYAVGTIAACAFAALLFKVVSSPEVQEMLTALIDRALKTNSE